MTEAEDNELIDSKIANGIKAVRGVPIWGRQSGNRLTKEEAQKWRNAPDTKTLKGVPDRSLLAVLIGCGLRRAEATIYLSRISNSAKDAGAIVDIVEKSDKMRTVPIPS